MSDTDKNAFSFTGFGEIKDKTFLGDLSNDDILKFSNATYTLSGFITVSGGKENALDINNSSNVELKNCILKLKLGENGSLVVKGNSRLICDENSRIIIYPSLNSKFDIEIDGWSDQSYEPSSININIERADGKPVRVVYGKVSKFTISGKYSVLRLYSVKLICFNLIKYTIRKILRYKLGEKGPF